MITKAQPTNVIVPELRIQTTMPVERFRSTGIPQPKQEFKRYQPIPRFFTKQPITTEKSS